MAMNEVTTDTGIGNTTEDFLGRALALASFLQVGIEGSFRDIERQGEPANLESVAWGAALCFDLLLGEIKGAMDVYEDHCEQIRRLKEQVADAPRRWRPL